MNDTLYQHSKLRRFRVYFDIEQLESTYESITYTKNKNITIELKNPIEKKPKHITFELSPKYPFHPPKIYIGPQHTPYVQSIDPKYSARIVKYMKYYKLPMYYIDTCKFINYNWSPALHLETIILEIECANRIKEIIKCAIILSDIVPDDISRHIISFVTHM
jgi:ubiquitin-protein ligase